MNSPVYRFLFRPGRFFLFVTFWLWIGWMNFIVLTSSKPPLPTAFLWWGVLLPLSLGVTFITMLHEPMHRSLGLLLPGMRARFRRSQFKVIGIGGLLCGALGHWCDESLSLLPLASLAAASFSLALPFEPGWRWAGSHLAAAVVAGIVPVILWSHGEIRSLFLLHPWLIACLCLVFVGLNFTVAFSRDRWRARANTPRVSLLSAMFNPELTALRKKETALQSGSAFGRTNASWHGDLTRSSLFNWFRAMRYERNGGRDRSLVFATGYIVGVMLFANFASGNRMILTLYQTVVPPASARGSVDFVFMLIAMWGVQYWGPRPQRIYPLSRARRARISFALSCGQIFLNFILTSGVFLVTAWGVAAWLGQPITLEHSGRFLMKLTLMLPLLPFLQWCRLHVEVREDKSMLHLSTVCLVLPVFTWQYFGPAWLSYVTTPQGAFCWLLLIGVSFGAYYAALRRFYRAGDLLQHGTTRKNFGLV